MLSMVLIIASFDLLITLTTLSLCKASKLGDEQLVKAFKEK